MSDKVAILIPCYNEEKTVEKVIKDFKKELPKLKYMYITTILVTKLMKLLVLLMA